MNRRLTPWILVALLTVGVFSQDDADSSFDKAAEASAPMESTVQRGSVTLDLRLDRSSARVAETILVRLRLESEAGTIVNAPAFEDLMIPWLLIDQNSIEDVPGELPDRRQWSWTLRLEAYQTGTQLIPAIPIAYRLPGESVFREIRSNPIDFPIVSVLGDDDDPANPREIKGPDVIASEPESPPAIGWIAAVTLIALIIFSTIIYRRRRQPDAVQYALQQIDAVQAAYDQETLSLEDSYQRLMLTLREFLQSRWHIPARAASTEELVRLLNDRAGVNVQLSGVIDGLREFMETGDRIRFAGDAFNSDASSRGTANRKHVFESVRELISQLEQPTETSSHPEVS